MQSMPMAFLIKPVEECAARKHCTKKSPSFKNALVFKGADTCRGSMETFKTMLWRKSFSKKVENEVMRRIGTNVFTYVIVNRTREILNKKGRCRSITRHRHDGDHVVRTLRTYPLGISMNGGGDLQVPPGALDMSGGCTCVNAPGVSSKQNLIYRRVVIEALPVKSMLKAECT